MDRLDRCSDAELLARTVRDPQAFAVLYRRHERLVLVTAGTAMAATGVWNPLIGDRTKAGPPTRSASGVPRAVRDALAVLRRAPTARDRGVAVQATLHGVSRAVVAGVRPGSIRYLAPAAGGSATILLSARRGGLVGSPAPGDARTVASHDALCVYRPIAADGGPSACFNLKQVLAGDAFATFGTVERSLVYASSPTASPPSPPTSPTTRPSASPSPTTTWRSRHRARPG